MTPGLNPETLDGIDSNWINKIIEEMRDESFKFRPARRIMIPKCNGKLRPLTIASPRDNWDKVVVDNLVQEVIRIILEVIFEPTFSEFSHGFRPGRGCHSCLKAVRTNFSQSVWVIEGDFKTCFDSIPHKLLLQIIQRRVKDQKFINLIAKSLKAGYGENRETIIGTPQGATQYVARFHEGTSVISPILCNIF